MKDYTQDELDYEEDHAANCNCLMCDSWRKSTRANRALAAMLNVTIPDGQEPKGAVAALIEAAQEIIDASIGSTRHLVAIGALQAALARVHVDTEARADMGEAAEGRQGAENG